MAAEAASFLNGLLASGRGGLLMRLTLVRALSAAGDEQGALTVAREAASLRCLR